MSQDLLPICVSDSVIDSDVRACVWPHSCVCVRVQRTECIQLHMAVLPRLSWNSLSSVRSEFLRHPPGTSESSMVVSQIPMGAFCEWRTAEFVWGSSELSFLEQCLNAINQTCDHVLLLTLNHGHMWHIDVWVWSKWHYLQILSKAMQVCLYSILAKGNAFFNLKTKH